MEIDLRNPGILVYGAAGIDYVALVSHYPEEDSKVRTTDAKQLVGGNAANTSAGKPIASFMVSVCIT